MASMVEPCRCGHTAWEACSYKQVFLMQYTGISYNSAFKQSGEHSFLAKFREYTCVFLMLKFETFQSSRVVQHMGSTSLPLLIITRRLRR